MNLNEILDVDVPVPGNSVPQVYVTPDVSLQANNTVQDDAAEIRKNVRTLIAQGTVAVTELLALARDLKTPRAYEVASNMLKTMSELSQDLLTVHQQEQSLVEPEAPVGNVNIQNAVFVGTTTQLGEILKQRRAEERAALAANTITVCPVTANTP